MLINRVLRSAGRGLFGARSKEAQGGMPDAGEAPDGIALVSRGDVFYDNKKYHEAESAYRLALSAGAPEELVNLKLQRVVFKIARLFDEPGMLRVPPGDGHAAPPNREVFDAMLDGVNRELATVPEVMPSKFWVSHADQHVDLLVRFGLGNFKRTVAHNYYNWLTVSVTDNQIARLLELWPVHGRSDALSDQMEDLSKHPAVRLSAFDDMNSQLFYRLGVSLLWDYTLHTDNHGLLRQLAEPVTGNPIRVTRRGRILSQDLAHSVRERNLIADAMGPVSEDKPLVIGELGAGHGRLAHVFAMSTNCRYMIFDIAPALLVSQWYIQSLFPGEKIFTFRHFDSYDEIAEELNACRFAFFASSQLEKLPEKYFDLFINVCSLMEMRIDSIHYFFRQIERVTRDFFYTKQWLIQNNREDQVVIERNDYPVPKTWKRLFDGIDPINQRLFQEVWCIK